MSKKNVAETEHHDGVKNRQDEIQPWDGKTIPQDWPVVNNWKVEIGSDLVFPKEAELKWAPVAPIAEDPVIWGLAQAYRGFIQIAVMQDQRIYTRFLNRVAEDRKTPQLEIKPWYVHRKKIVKDGKEVFVTAQVLGKDWEEVRRNAAHLLQSQEFRARVFTPAIINRPAIAINEASEDEVSE